MRTATALIFGNFVTLVLSGTEVHTVNEGGPIVTENFYIPALAELKFEEALEGLRMLEDAQGGF